MIEMINSIFKIKGHSQNPTKYFVPYCNDVHILFNFKVFFLKIWG